MADITQLERALINADAAGDEDAARVIAAEIIKVRGAPKAKETSFFSGLVQGFRDPLDAAAQMLEKGVSALGVPTEKINQALGMPSADEARVAASRNIEELLGAPGTGGRVVGNVVSTMPLAMAMPAASPSLGGMALQGMASGAGFGAMQPVEKGDFWKEKLKQVATGAASGAVAAPLVGAAARVVSPQSVQRVKPLLDEGVTPTPGQILGGSFKAAEDKAMSIPVVGDFITSARRKAVEEMNRAAYGRAIGPIGGEVPKTVGREGVASVKAQLGKAYDDLLGKMRFVPDEQFSAELGNLQSLVGSLPKREARAFTDIVNRELSGRLTPGGVISGESLKTIESQLGKAAKQFTGSNDAYQQQVGSALKEVQNIFKRGIERSNPEYAEQLAKINQGYANYARIRDAASRAGSSDGVITPAQLSAAVRAQDKTVGKGATATGTAYMQDLSDLSKSVLGPGYPDSGTAGRLLFSGMVGGGTSMLAPGVGVGAGIASLPYMPGGRQMMAALLAKRPESAEQIAEAIRQIALPSSIAAPALGQLLLQ